MMSTRDRLNRFKNGILPNAETVISAFDNQAGTSAPDTTAIGSTMASTVFSNRTTTHNSAHPIQEPQQTLQKKEITPSQKMEVELKKQQQSTAEMHRNVLIHQNFLKNKERGFSLQKDPVIEAVGKTIKVVKNTIGIGRGR